MALAAILCVCGCSDSTGERPAAGTEGRLLRSVSVFATNEDGSPKPLPARMAILTPEDSGWNHRFIEDPDSNVFHKAMVQQGAVVRYVPATGEGPVVVAGLGTRHAKEILVADVDGDGRDELYVSVEAVSGGQVEIRRYVWDADSAAHWAARWRLRRSR